MAIGGNMSDYLAERYLRQLDATWMALNYQDPLVGDPAISEITGGGYQRQLLRFTQPTNRSTFCQDRIAFTGLPAGVITHASLWDSSIGGNMLWAFALPNHEIMIEGGTKVWPALSLAVSL